MVYFMKNNCKLIYFFVCLLVVSPISLRALTAKEAGEYRAIQVHYSRLLNGDTKVSQWDSVLANITRFREGLKDKQAFDDVEYMAGLCHFQASLAGKKGSWERAEAIFTDIAKKGRTGGELSANALFMLGRMHEQKKDYEKAFKSYSAILTGYAGEPIAAKALNRAEHCLAASPRLKAKIGKDLLTRGGSESRLDKKNVLWAGAVKGADLTDVKIWSARKSTRFVLEFSGEPGYTYKELKDENALQLDFPNTRSTALIRSLAIDDGLVKLIQIEDLGGGTRLIVRLDNPDGYRVFPLYEPYRLILDVEGDKIERPAYIGPAPIAIKPAVTSKPPVVVRPSTPELPLRPLPSFYKIRTIVIDSGHGGHDSGALGVGGLKEKDINLSVALRLEKLLSRNPAYEVFLTRKADVFIPLEQRAAFANQKDADLFISIHANAGPRSGTDSGFETYYLGPASDQAAVLAAKYENGKNVRDTSELLSIVRQFKKAVKGRESIGLASVIQRELVSLLGFPDRGIKTAPFAVLVGTRMPAVLAELGFVSNPHEAKLLRDPSTRQKLALGLYNAVTKYADRDDSSEKAAL